MSLIGSEASVYRAAFVIFLYEEVYPQTRLFAVPARVVQFSSRGGFSEHWPPQNEDIISMLAKQHKTVRKNAPTEEIRLWTDRNTVNS